MSEDKPKIKADKVRVSPLLLEQLRQEESTYKNRGKMAPKYGDMLEEAWRAFKAKPAAPVPDRHCDADVNFLRRMKDLLVAMEAAVRGYVASTDKPLDKVPVELEPVLGQCAEVLRSGDVKVIQHVRQQVELAYQSVFGGGARTKSQPPKATRS